MRKRYVNVENERNQLSCEEAERKIQHLEEELLKYKLQIKVLEKSLAQYLPPVIFNEV